MKKKKKKNPIEKNHKNIHIERKSHYKNTKYFDNMSTKYK